ncbi:hypothetical protein [Actinacidiphila sp. bgisy144]|uniref:hypothetical protein n=1 Tax=Actinacidiphila sp. bgisy144 TaxID=3413791 RepID=UPI003EBDA37B
MIVYTVTLRVTAPKQARTEQIVTAAADAEEARRRAVRAITDRYPETRVQVQTVRQRPYEPPTEARDSAAPQLVVRRPLSALQRGQWVQVHGRPLRIADMRRGGEGWGERIIHLAGHGPDEAPPPPLRLKPNELLLVYIARPPHAARG